MREPQLQELADACGKEIGELEELESDGGWPSVTRGFRCCAVSCARSVAAAFGHELEDTNGSFCVDCPDQRVDRELLPLLGSVLQAEAPSAVSRALPRRPLWRGARGVAACCILRARRGALGACLATMMVSTARCVRQVSAVGDWTALYLRYTESLSSRPHGRHDRVLEWLVSS